MVTWRRLRLRALASAIFLMGRVSTARITAFSASTSSLDTTAGGLHTPHTVSELVEVLVRAWGQKQIVARDTTDLPICQVGDAQAHSTQE